MGCLIDDMHIVSYYPLASQEKAVREEILKQEIKEMNKVRRERAFGKGGRLTKRHTILTLRNACVLLTTPSRNSIASCAISSTRLSWR